MSENNNPHIPRRSPRNIKKQSYAENVDYEYFPPSDDSDDDNDEPSRKKVKINEYSDDEEDHQETTPEMLSHDDNNGRELSTTESVNLDQHISDQELFEPLEKQLPSETTTKPSTIKTTEEQQSTKTSMVETTTIEQSGITEQQEQIPISRKPSIMENLLDKPINYRLEIVSQLLKSLQNEYEQAEQKAESLSDVIRRATFTTEELDKLNNEKLNQLRKALQNSANIATEILLERK